MASLVVLLLAVTLSSATLIVTKNLGGEGHVNQGSELLVTLQIFNQHHSTVYDVTLADSWSEDFEIINGLTKATWESIPASGSVSHSYLVRPLKAGLTDFSRADVSYRCVGGAELHLLASFLTNRPERHGAVQFVQSTHENQYAQGWIQIYLGSEVNLKSGVHTVCHSALVLCFFSIC